MRRIQDLALTLAMCLALIPFALLWRREIDEMYAGVDDFVATH